MGTANLSNFAPKTRSSCGNLAAKNESAADSAQEDNGQSMGPNSYDRHDLLRESSPTLGTSFSPLCNNGRNVKSTKLSTRGTLLRPGSPELLVSGVCWSGLGRLAVPKSGARNDGIARVASRAANFGLDHHLEHSPQAARRWPHTAVAQCRANDLASTFAKTHTRNEKLLPKERLLL